MRFWDSSAIVPLVIQQKQSPAADRWIAEDAELVIWTFTPVEITSALWRMVREGALDEDDAGVAEDRARALVEASHTVTDVEAVKRHAQRMLRVHPLRAADALQLAAAIRWSAGADAAMTMHTFDERLALAARREGFRVP